MKRLVYFIISLKFRYNSFIFFKNILNIFKLQRYMFCHVGAFYFVLCGLFAACSIISMQMLIDCVTDLRSALALTASA